MTSGLRKAHKYIWLVLVISVPILMFFSVKDLAIFSLEKQTANIIIDTSKKNAIASTENAIIKAYLYESQLDIILKTTLKNSSSIVYEMDDSGNKSNSIGQLTTAGNYKFNIKNLPKGIIIYDALKAIEITKLTFQWD